MSYTIEIKTRESFGGSIHTIGSYSHYMGAVTVAAEEVKWESTESVKIIDADGNQMCHVPGDFS